MIAEVEQFEEAQQLPVHIRRRDRYVQFAVAAALQAVCDAQLDVSSAAIRDHWGIAFTSAVGPAQATEAAYCLATQNGAEAVDPAKIPPEFYLDWICNAPTLLLAQLFDVHGPCDSISSACTSGVDVIGYAYESIRRR